MITEREYLASIKGYEIVDCVVRNQQGTSINRPYPPPDHASRAPTMRLLVF